jgi:hypothetical protein
MNRRNLTMPLLAICAICILMPTIARAQIEDIILDLEDPDDYVDEVVASLEREQAERERQQVEAAARCRVRCLTNREVSL